MPNYDYRCEACGHELELFQSMRESAKRKCPACKRMKLVRLIGSGGGILFKGTGFYQTDYRSDSYKSAAKAETDSSTPKSSETKPGAQGETKKKPEPKSSDGD